MASRALVWVGFVVCFVVTFFLLESRNRYPLYANNPQFSCRPTPISDTEKAVWSASPSLLPMDIFDRNDRSQESTTDGWLQNRGLNELEHRAMLDENFKEIQSQDRTIQVKSALATDAQELIVLVSTLGRGGSSWIGELLATMKDEVMYVFEPLKIISDVYDSRITPAFSNEIMSTVLSCQFTKDFVMFQSRWPQNFKKFPDECKEGCQTPNSISRRCRLAETVVVKTIRMPLGHVEDLLNKPSFRHMKVIYLARDPRAQVLSRFNVFNVKNPDFNNECPRVEADVFAFHRLSQLFPGHLYFMRYEDMCQDPIGEATQLWRFLQTNHTAEIPASWTTFLSDHLKRAGEANKNDNPYSTFRDSTTEWYKWRLELQNSTLRLMDVEKECHEAMDKLGYIPLHTLTNLRNLSVPFLKNYSCDFWNCWSYKF